MAHWEHLDSIDSTNLEAKRYIDQQRFDGDFVVTADAQTQGRGQRGNVWSSQPKENLILSYATPLQLSHEFIPLLSLWIGLSIAQILAQKSLPINVKWPNDLYSKTDQAEDSKKIGGILIERHRAQSLGEEQSLRSDQDYWIIGVGINIHSTTLPQVISDHASSLQIEYPQMLPKNFTPILANEIVHAWKSAFQSPLNFKKKLLTTHQLFNSHHVYHGKKITLQNGETTESGTVKGITPTGAIILETDTTLTAYPNAHTLRLALS